jgi:hypothetical protein
MEAQRSTNFNEFYRSTDEHLVNIRAPRMFWQGVVPRKFANFKVQNEECHYYVYSWICMFRFVYAFLCSNVFWKATCTHIWAIEPCYKLLICCQLWNPSFDSKLKGQILCETKTCLVFDLCSTRSMLSFELWFTSLHCGY